ncbi:MAG TPA: hypothetical protein IAA58_00580 [Candidatus Gallacutalibacter stercoravium]|nr:hypothetical protein [Candidatus Gallacutalibacter stercoravium]
MQYASIGKNNRISRVGIGGHYSKMEEGRFEASYAQVSRQEVKARTEMLERAFDSGVTYYDTTWRNEVEMLAQSMAPLHIRDKVHINGMVLGTFTGSVAAGITPSQYIDRWLDERLAVLPQNHLDSFMINAIDEGYDPGACAQVLEHLEKRRQQGDFDIIGFSCHNHTLARQIADTFPQFQLIMLAYNYKNRAFETAFDGYSGSASFVAMKPLIWYEYGIPFCALNRLPNAEQLLGGLMDSHVAAKAVAWNLHNPRITTCVCGVNSQQELDDLLLAGNTGWQQEDEAVLERYRRCVEENRIPFFIGICKGGAGNRRSFQFGLRNLAGALGVPMEHIPLNDDASDELLLRFWQKLKAEAQKQGYGACLEE